MESQSISLAGTIEGTTAANLVPNVAAAATAQGFKVAAPVPGTLMLTRSFRPAWAKWTGAAIIALALAIGTVAATPALWILVLIGVAAIVFIRASETVSLVVIDGAEGVDVRATGTAGESLAAFVGGLLPKPGAAA